MKHSITSLILFLIAFSYSFGQDWISFDSIDNRRIRLAQLKCNPETNSIITSYGNNTAEILLIKDNGNTKYYTRLPELNPNFQITTCDVAHDYDVTGNDTIYFINEGYGLFKINTESDQISYLDPFTGYRTIYIHQDSIWITGDQTGMGRIFVNDNEVGPFDFNKSSLIKYKGKIYGHWPITYSYGLSSRIGNSISTNYSTSNSDIIGNQISSLATNNPVSGQLFIGTKEGLSQFNGATFLNYTPTTHPDMPYKTVLDVEYDKKNGKVWMILADENENPKTLTSYNGSWESYDTSNSPIDFTQYRDMVVDTLGQIWIGEHKKIHVLNTNELEGWLGTSEQPTTEFVNVKAYPNPSKGFVNFDIDANKVKEILIFDLDGKVVFTSRKKTNALQINLPNGIYNFQITTTNEQHHHGKIVLVE